MAAAAIIEITNDVITQFGRKLSATSRTGVCISAKGISVFMPLKISETPPYEPSTSTKLIAKPSGIFFEGFFISPPNSSKLIKPANEKYPILAAIKTDTMPFGIKGVKFSTSNRGKPEIINMLSIIRKNITMAPCTFTTSDEPTIFISPKSNMIDAAATVLSRDGIK